MAGRRRGAWEAAQPLPTLPYVLVMWVLRGAWHRPYARQPQLQRLGMGTGKLALSNRWVVLFSAGPERGR